MDVLQHPGYAANSSSRTQLLVIPRENPLAIPRPVSLASLAVLLHVPSAMPPVSLLPRRAARNASPVAFCFAFHRRTASMRRCFCSGVNVLRFATTALSPGGDRETGAASGAMLTQHFAQK